MKKNFWVAVLALWAVQANAQEVTYEQKAKAVAKAYELFDNYANLSGLKDPKAGKVTDTSVVLFVGLFAPGAQIHDDINDADVNDAELTTISKPVMTYATDVKKNFPNGLNSKVTKVNVSYSGLAQREAKIVYEHTVNATTADGKLYLNKDTLRMAIKFNEDFSRATIAGITSIGGKLTCNNCDVKPVAVKPVPAKPKPEPTEPGCPNDVDCDGVINALDNCPDRKGSADNQGCPDKAPIAFEIGLNVGLGMGINSFGSADFAPLANTAYQNLVVEGDSKAKLKGKAGFGVNVGLEFGLFFGKKKNIGLGTGIIFATSTTSFGMDEVKMHYRETDAEQIGFRRILTVKDYKEKVAFTNLSIPVLLKYRTPTSKTQKVGFSFEIGPVISVYSAAKSKAGSTMDFEAVYSTGGGLGSGTYTTENQATDWLLTKEAVDRHLNGNVYPTIADYFEKHYARGYYVGLDHKTEDVDAGSVKYKIGAGGLLRLGMVYQITDALFFNAGLHLLLTSTSVVTNTENAPFDVKNSFQDADGVSYNSLLSSTKSTAATQFGLTLGIHYRITK